MGIYDIASGPDEPIHPLNTLRDAVRYRPGMYIGGTDDRAVHNMLLDMLDCLLHEPYFGKCTYMQVTLKPDQIVAIYARNAGYLIENQESEGISKLQLLFEHGMRGSNRGYSTMITPLYGASLPIANALSEWMIVEVAQDSYLWQQSYETGIPLVPITKVRALESGEPCGLSITYRPDFTIFSELFEQNYRYDILSRRCAELAYFHAGLPITLRDERDEPRQDNFYAERGLYDFVDDLRDPISQPISDIVHATKASSLRTRNRTYPLKLEFAFQFLNQPVCRELGFANDFNARDGGYHIDSLHTGILRILNRYRPPSIPYFRWQDIAPSINAVINIAYERAQFQSQTNLRLVSQEVSRPITRMVAEAFDAFAAEYPDQMQCIIDHCLANRERRRSTRA